jgi:DNA (cytosine-5)-methyltransferase 1
LGAGGVRELSLFTGAGGGLLGTKLLGWTHVGYVEWNEYCQRVIAARIADGYLDRAPIFTDVREFAQSGAAEQYRGIADVVSAGFPCQPFSVAGKQLAGDDERNMWPATVAVIRAVRPRSVLLENVPGLVSCGYVGTVLCDLAAMGYVGKWGVLGAADAGAPHKRDRLWIIAHAEGESSNGCGDHAGICLEPGSFSELGNRSRSADVAYTDSAQRAGVRESFGVRSEHANARGPSRWWSADPADDPESGVGRMAPRMAYGVDRLKAIGNGQVPGVAARAWGLLA